MLSAANVSQTVYRKHIIDCDCDRITINEFIAIAIHRSITNKYIYTYAFTFC